MTETILGEFEQTVMLGIIQTGEDAFALEVRRWIELECRRSVSRGAFYTSLERLRDKGLVAWKLSRPKTARRQGLQRHFAVTPAGLQALRETRAHLESRCSQLDDGLENA